MPYYIGDVIKEYKRLVIRTPEDFKKTGIDVKIKTRVEGIEPAKGTVHLSDGSALPYDILVMATGAEAVKLGLPGEDLEGVFTLRNLTDALRIKSFLNEKKCRKAVIVGAGYIGMEMCEAFRNNGLEVQVIDILPRPVLRWDAEFAKLILDELGKNQVTFMPETKPLSIERGKDSALRLVTDKGNLEADIILIGVGSRPNTKLAESLGVEMGRSAIKVDFFQRTSREEVYAVGDCCEVFHRVIGKWTYNPLGDVANKQGRTAGQNIGGASTKFPGVVGAQSFKVFNLEAAATGITEEEALNHGFQPVSAIIQGLPVGRPMARGEKLALKLVADKATGKLLGAQSVAEKGSVTRINCLSVALWNGMTLEEIGHLDLAYAPPFGGAWDAIHIAAQMLMRKL
ncbi:MAG TPA: FAD-dependent oxidoreductase [Syntrophales bacterium]|nr:FAD-dependent oxidoreductase [Syntrophales bacterium]HRT28008.1 FAD-dependent oxidoreductase [Syntrophales bacterium]HRT71130.1 FAD-dependent oxidoreductase [Syntrophales bacterium]